MKKVTNYICEKCGFSSPNIKEVIQCEVQPIGLQQYKKGDKVTVTDAKESNVERTIIEVVIVEKTHKVAYLLDNYEIFEP